MSIKHDIELVASDKLLLITTVIDDKSKSFETNADSSTEASLNQLCIVCTIMTTTSDTLRK